MNMRDAFLGELYQLAKTDKRVVLLSDDFGAPRLDAFRRDLPDQYLFAGIAEQNITGVAAGLALSGKIVFTYGIAPFTTERCFEQVRLDVCAMNLNVNIIGVGAGFGYDTAGPTHHALDDIALMSTIPNMTIYSPSDNIAAAHFAHVCYKHDGPKYVRLDRESLPDLWKFNGEGPYDFVYGMGTPANDGHSPDIVIFTTGRMVHRAIEVSGALAELGLAVDVVDVYRLKPLNEYQIPRYVKHAQAVVTLEEHVLNGGLGSMVSRVLAGSGKPLKCIGIPDRFFWKYGGRDELHACCGLDAKSVTDRIWRMVSNDKDA